MANHTHERTRLDHATELAEDYVEAIDDIIKESGVCRAIDLVKHFKVHSRDRKQLSRAIGSRWFRNQPALPADRIDGQRKEACEKGPVSTRDGRAVSAHAWSKRRGCANR